MEKESTNVSIPNSLYKKIEEKIKGSEIKSVSSYITKVWGILTEGSRLILLTIWHYSEYT